MSKILVTTIPFGEKNPLPLELMDEASIDYQINPLGRKLTEEELAELISDFDVIIAGTENISEKVMERGKNLKLISRVGVGLDGVDLLAAERRGIRVSYTPDAPASAVAELTIGLMLSLLRSIHIANGQLHRRIWHRHFGRRISEVTLGIIGIGRIGSAVIKRLEGFNPRSILINDIHLDRFQPSNNIIQWSSKETIYREADVISLHVPLTETTKNMINRDHLLKMKADALLINTARGGIVNEEELANVLRSGHLGGAAIDVFEIEPYKGELAVVENCLLTSHMGSMSLDCRARMEIEATKEAIRFLSGEALQAAVPREEYDLQRRKAL